MNKRDYETAIRDEVEEWPGVTVDFVNPTGKGHPKAKFTFEGKMLFRPYPSTPSDAFFGIHRCLGDMRKIMKQLGATRSRPEPSEEEVEKRYNKPNEGAAKRQDPVREKAEVQPDVSDQLVTAGAVTAERRAAVQAEGSAETYGRKTLFERMAKQARETIVVPDDGETVEQASAEVRREELADLIASIADGVYFDLPEDVYHAVPALGSSSLGEIIISPATFWCGSWLDPDRPELDADETAAQKIGKAYHCARLEPERFAAIYVREPCKADFACARMLTSDAAVKAALKDLGEQQTVAGETPSHRAQRLLDAGFEGVIFPLEYALWEATLAGRETATLRLPAAVWDDILRDIERLQKVPEVAALLQDGFSEVSVFWTDEHGLRCKARFDKLASDHWTDFKTFANPSRKALDQVIADAFRYNRYYMQAVHYRDGAEAIRGGLEVHGEATDEQRAMIAALQARESELACWYVFQEKGGVPNLLAKRFKFKDLDDPAREHELRTIAADDPIRLEWLREAQSRRTQIHLRGAADIRRAKEIFMLYSQVYPPGEPWSPIEPIGEIGDADFNPHWLEGN